MRLKIPGMLAVTILAAFLIQTTHATTVLQMTLDDLTSRADRVFRGNVLSAEPGSTEIGGGSLPTVTYRLLVGERFKGDYPSDDEKVVVTVTMLGNLKQGGDVVNGQRHFNALPDLPELTVGRDYVLFTTKPSAVGLSTTVGLGQGAFKIFPAPDGGEMVANELNNAGLFDGPVNYAALARAIRVAVRN